MNTASPTVHRPMAVPATVVRWAARVSSVLVAALIALFALEPAGPPTAKEIVALALFPGCVLVGMAIAWWRELLGAAVSLAGLGAFYLWMVVAAGRFPGGPYFLIFSAPAFLFLTAGLMRRSAKACRCAGHC